MFPKWYYENNGELKGPCSAGELIELMENEKIPRGTLICREDSMQQREPLEDCHLLKLDTAKPNIRALPNVFPLKNDHQPLEDPGWLQQLRSRDALMEAAMGLQGWVQNHNDARQVLLDAGATSEQVELMELSLPCPDCDAVGIHANCPFGLINQDGEIRIAFRCEKTRDNCDVKQRETPDTTPHWVWE